MFISTYLLQIHFLEASKTGGDLEALLGGEAAPGGLQRQVAGEPLLCPWNMTLLFLPTQKKEAEGLPNVWGWVVGLRGQGVFWNKPRKAEKVGKWGRGRRTTHPQTQSPYCQPSQSLICQTSPSHLQKVSWFPCSAPVPLPFPPLGAPTSPCSEGCGSV